MIGFVEICRRTATGRLVAEARFDQEIFFPKIKELVKKYDIKPDLENPVTTDDGVADSIFHAAVDLLQEMGVYCTDSQRIIELSQMRATLAAIREKGLSVKAMVGGAPVNQAFADKIGADGYSADAPGVVELARKLLSPCAFT